MAWSDDLAAFIGSLQPSEAQLRAAQRSPMQMALSVREVLRYDSPVRHTGRRVAMEITLHGRTLRSGNLVLSLIGSANRDPDRFADADCFDIGRRDGMHLSFNSGVHVCIGAEAGAARC